MGRKAIVLASGGVGSTTALAYALAANLDCHLLTLHGPEDDIMSDLAATRISVQFRVPIRMVSAQAHRADRTGLIRLGHAAALAAELEAQVILLGTCAKHKEVHQQPGFYNLFAKTAGAALGRDLSVYSPVALLEREDVVNWGVRTFGLDYSRTHDCTAGRDVTTRSARTHCGRCPGCLERRRAFAATGVLDPARYELAAVA